MGIMLHNSPASMDQIQRGLPEGGREGSNSHVLRFCPFAFLSVTHELHTHFLSSLPLRNAHSCWFFRIFHMTPRTCLFTKFPKTFNSFLSATASRQICLLVLSFYRVPTLMLLTYVERVLYFSVYQLTLFYLCCLLCTHFPCRCS